MYRSILFLALLQLPTLFLYPAESEKTVELVANFTIDSNHLNSLLHSTGSSSTIVCSDLSQYGAAFIRKNTRWHRLLRKLKLDYPQSIALKEGVEKIMFWNLSAPYRKERNLHKLPKEKLVLFLWEPPTVLPKMYAPKTLARFGKIYTWNDDLVDNQTYFKLFYPVLRPMIETLPTFEEKKLCAMVATNIQRKLPNELYSERKKAVEFFEAIAEPGFDLYGKKWDTGYRCYRGPVADKIGTICNYRFCICYENTSNIKGYITEKIFDCFAAGSIPIYWGATNVTDYIPKNCFIDRRDFANMDELYTFIKNMSKADYLGYIERIRDYLNSEQAQLFSYHHFANILAESIASDTKQ